MRILLITQWYKPIKSAAAKRTGKMAKFLSEAGHKVTVLTGMPSYPLGILPKEYKWKLWASEKDGKIRILRTYEYPVANVGIAKRLINNFSFVISSSLTALFIPFFDAVIVSSPSFFSGITGLAASLNKKTKFYFDVRDLWPDSIIQMGLLNAASTPTKLLKKLENKFYHRSEKIIVSTPAIKEHLVSEGINDDKITVLLNSADMKLFSPRKADKTDFHFKSTDFVCLYVGNHSRLYDLATAIKAADILKKKKDIRLVFVGEGEEKDHLIALKTKLKLDNVHFVAEKHIEEVAEYMNMADATLIPLSKTKVTQASMPTKTSEYLGAGKPIIASISGDMRQYLTDAQAALFYESGNAKELAQGILTLYKDPALAKKMGQNARKLALKVFSDQTFAKTLVQTISS